MRVSGGRIRAFANFAGAGEPTVSDIGVLAQSGKGWKADPEGNCDRGMTWDRLGVGRREGDWRHCMRAPLRDFTNWGPPKAGVVMIIVKSIAPVGKFSHGIRTAPKSISLPAQCPPS